MSRKILNFNTDAWIPDLKELCFNFLKYLQNKPGGKFLYFNDLIGDNGKPGVIVREYHRKVKELKLNIFGGKADSELIDYHKIGALYIRSFLKYRPFRLDIPKEIKEPSLCMYTESPNEYFIIAFLQTLFDAWNGNDGILQMGEVYENSFIRLLHQYGKNIKTLDPTSFSNTIYLIEQKYFIH